MVQTSNSVQNIFQIIPTNYPNTLLLGSKPYNLTFNATNYSPKSEKFQITFKGQGLDIDLPTQFQGPIEINGTQTIPISIVIKPTINGQAKIIIETIHQKTIEYTEMVWYVKDKLDSKFVDEALEQVFYQRSPFEEPKYPNIKVELPPASNTISKDEAETLIKELDSVIEIRTPAENIELETTENLETNLEASFDDIGAVNEYNEGKNSELLKEKPEIEEIVQIKPKYTEQEKNQKTSEIVLQVFESVPDYSISLIKNITDNGIVQKLLNQLILPYSLKNLDAALEKINKIDSNEIKQEILEKIICLYMKTNTQLALSLMKNIENSDKHDKILTEAIAICSLKDPVSGLPLIQQIINPDIKQKLLIQWIGNFSQTLPTEAFQNISQIQDTNINLALTFEIVKAFYTSNKSKCVEVLNSLNKQCIEKNNHILLKFGIYLLADLSGTQNTVKFIDTLPDNVKGIVKKDMHPKLWEEKEEKRTRIDQIPVSSIYYTFNTAVKPNKAVEMVHTLGGNLSENLLAGDFSSFIGMICPFSYSFPIFPSIEQSYSEIKREKQKSFYYMIIPTKFKTEEEFLFIQSLLNTWFVANEANFSTKVYLFNVDFIPYLSKPTIIMGNEPEDNLVIKSIVERVFQDSVSFIIDEGLFNGGMTKSVLQKILPQNKFKVINLVMTYDFLKDYRLLKNFMNEFIK